MEIDSIWGALSLGPWPLLKAEELKRAIIAAATFADLLQPLDPQGAQETAAALRSVRLQPYGPYAYALHGAAAHRLLLIASVVAMEQQLIPHVDELTTDGRLPPCSSALRNSLELVQYLEEILSAPPGQHPSTHYVRALRRAFSSVSMLQLCSKPRAWILELDPVIPDPTSIATVEQLQAVKDLLSVFVRHSGCLRCAGQMGEWASLVETLGRPCLAQVTVSQVKPLPTCAISCSSLVPQQVAEARDKSLATLGQLQRKLLTSSALELSGLQLLDNDPLHGSCGSVAFQDFADILSKLETHPLPIAMDSPGIWFSSDGTGPSCEAWKDNIDAKSRSTYKKGLDCWRKGDLARARFLFEESLHEAIIHRGIGGSNECDRLGSFRAWEAVARASLVAVLVANRNPEPALLWHLKALQDDQESGHLVSVEARVAMAAYCYQTGDPAASQGHYESAVSSLEELLGQGHPLTLRVRCSLAAVHADRSYLEAANMGYRQVDVLADSPEPASILSQGWQMLRDPSEARLKELTPPINR